MKQMTTIFTILVGILFFFPDAYSGLLGDVDNNGNIGLTEAMNALQVTSGLRSPIETSYVIVWKGAWNTSQSYQIYDAVHFNGSSYLCLQNHTSDLSNQPPTEPTWEPLSLRGENGETGPKGPQGEPGPLNPNVNMDSVKYNTALGYQVLYSNTTGLANTATGYQVLYSNTTGSRNTASGNYALFHNTKGNDNVASGFQALQANTEGSSNTASGNMALVCNTTGSFNIALGKGALYSNTTGNRNTAAGFFVLQANDEGSFNTAMGSEALFFNTTVKLWDVFQLCKIMGRLSIIQ